MNDVRYPLALLCTTRAWGGIELNTLRLGRWMTARGWPCVIVTDAEAPLRQAAMDEGMEVLPLHRPWRYADVVNAWRLAAMLRTRGARAIIANATRDLNLAVLAAGLSRQRPAVLTVQHMQIGVDKRDALHRWHYRRVDAWIAPLHSLARQAEERTSMPAARIHVIPLGIELDRFPRVDAASRHAARAGLALPMEAGVVGCIGRLDPGKDQETLVRAVARMCAEGRDIHLALIGDETRDSRSGYGDRLVSLSAALGISDRVHLRPHAADVTRVYPAFDVFALPSIAETYGMVTIEAMASGLPVAATNTGGTPDIVTDGETGLLFPPRDPVAAAAAITALLDAPERARRLGDAARCDIQRRFSHDAQCGAYEHVLRQLDPRGK